jgi:hypothetical protein
MENLEPDEIGRKLGLADLRGRELIAVEYDIESRLLHIPTILDAKLHPTFVPKQTGRDGLPRAWDWEDGMWGLPDIVHAPSVPTQRTSVRLLGSVSDAGQPPELRTYSFSMSERLATLVATVLRQTCAHKGLEPFINGRRSVLDLTPLEFERFLALLFQRKGYRTTVTQATWDKGYDIVAVSDLSAGEALLIEAKRTKNKVGIGIIRHLAGARHFADAELRCHMLVVATTGFFTGPAQRLAAERATEVKLLDYIANETMKVEHPPRPRACVTEPESLE